MTARITQIPENRRNGSLRPIAVLSLEPADLRERFGLDFLADDRGDSVAALLQIRSGGQYLLLRHRDAPRPGTEVLAREGGLSEPDLVEFLEALELERDAVSWTLTDANWTVNHGLAGGQLDPTPQLERARRTTVWTPRVRSLDQQTAGGYTVPA